jgi:hypothetical protein
LTPTTHQLNPAPLSFEKTVSQHFDVYVHPELEQTGQPKFDEKGRVVLRLNRRGQRRLLALQRRKQRSIARAARRAR